MTKGMKKYFKKKIFWFIITFIAAVILNFILPRLMPGDPVNSIVGKNISPGATQEQVQEQIAYYKHQFGLDKDIFGQFWDFVKNAFNGTFGVSYSQYPRLVSDIIGSSIWWTVALQLPAILVGWLLGNLLGAMAAYKRSVYDKVLMPVTLFFSAIPAFGAAVILLVLFAVTLGWAPVNGAFDPGMIPSFSWKFISSVIAHYQLPFWSIVLISIGGQAVGMRSMSIYELNADYVKYARFLGIKDKKADCPLRFPERHAAAGHRPGDVHRLHGRRRTGCGNHLQLSRPGHVHVRGDQLVGLSGYFRLYPDHHDHGTDCQFPARYYLCVH